jgi:hypothetical protein
LSLVTDSLPVLMRDWPVRGMRAIVQAVKLQL